LLSILLIPILPIISLSTMHAKPLQPRLLRSRIRSTAYLIGRRRSSRRALSRCRNRRTQRNSRRRLRGRRSRGRPPTAATKVTAHHQRLTKDPRKRLPIPTLGDLNPASRMKSICRSRRKAIR
jgi:hypothetical protein